MQITQKHLIDSLNNLYEPYPEFTLPGDKQKFLKQLLKHLNLPMSQKDIEEHGNPAEIVYDDISDDIQNCGRNPLSCFMDNSKRLFYIKETNHQDFLTIIDYLTEQINTYLSE